MTDFGAFSTFANPHKIVHYDVLLSLILKRAKINRRFFRCMAPILSDGPIPLSSLSGSDPRVKNQSQSYFLAVRLVP